MSASAYYHRARARDRRGWSRTRSCWSGSRPCTPPTTTPTATGARGWRCAATGVEVGRDRVKRLMRANGIQGAKRRGKPWRTTIADPAAVRPPDRVNRDFTAAGPDRLWVADFCYLRCWEGVVFFAFVIDVYSRRIVGWQLAGHMRTDLVLDALRMALTRRRAGADVELVHHSDAGSQYTSYAFTQVLDDHGVLASIGIGRRRLRQRPRRELRRFLQDRADSRPRLAHPRAARARDRRIRRLVQPRPPARGARRHPARRVRAAPLRQGRDFGQRIGRGTLPSPQIASTRLDLSANAPEPRNSTLWPTGPGSRLRRLSPTIDRRKPTNPVSANPSPAHLVWTVLDAVGGLDPVGVVGSGRRC